MKILLWPAFYLPEIGGLEIMTHQLAVQLQKMGHEVFVISTNIRSDHFEEKLIDQVNIFLFPFIRALSTNNLFLIKKIMDRIHQLCDQFSPDILNIHGWYECPGFYQIRVWEKRKIPFCMTIHSLIEQAHYNTPACLKLWSVAKKISAVSKALIDELTQLKFQTKETRLIYNALPQPEKPILPFQIENLFRLVMVGRLTERKGFVTAFNAIHKLIGKYPTLKLIVVGGGFQFDELVTLKHKLQLNAHIEMTNYVQPGEKIYEYMDQASVVLVPSYYEGFPLVALEAAMRGKAVIATNIAGLNEIVQHDKTGLLVEPKNSEALADSIDYLLSHPEKIQAMGIAAKENVAKYFTIKNIANQYLKMFQDAQQQAIF